ncbi:MAG: hypothetical protein P8H03_08160, partial [Emcibacteraceae bacterium]|nr:hypothetical protein [Emcibacteraceae bacterium]
MNVDQNLMILIGMGILALLLCVVLYIVNQRFRMDGEERKIAADKAADTITSVMQMNAGLE